MKVLCQVKEKAKALNLKKIDLVLDQAVYCKPVKIVISTHFRSFVNLGMGDFHATCVFLSVFGKRFADGELKDLVVESGFHGKIRHLKCLKENIITMASEYYQYVTLSTLFTLSTLSTNMLLYPP